MTDITCSGCRHWHAIAQVAGQPPHSDGTCQRFPPVRGADLMSRYPVIAGDRPDLICGEHPAMLRAVARLMKQR